MISEDTSGRDGAVLESKAFVIEMRRDDQGDFKRLGTAIEAVVKRIRSDPVSTLDTTTMSAVFSKWSEIVGEGASAHIRPLRVSNEVLVIAADHPAWATRAKADSARILTKLEAISGKAPRRVEVVVRRG
ncbi:MAG: DUF721 domain-containing protein [Acidimicrobiales bacterium]